MLTEGWDANTVTHILGVRAVRQPAAVRAGRRPWPAPAIYAVNDSGRFEPEYANVYGIPFEFIPTDKPTQGSAAAEAGRSRSRPSRAASTCAITFPKLDGYRVEMPDDEHLRSTSSDAPRFEIGPNTVPRWVEMQGVVGAGERERRRGRPAQYRPQQVAFALAKRILDAQFNTRRRQAAVAVPRAGRDLP